VTKFGKNTRIKSHSQEGSGLTPYSESHVVLSLPLDSDKHFAAVEPPAEGPEDGEDEEALHERTGGAFEEAVA
jgi:hypothetical protein